MLALSKHFWTVHDETWEGLVVKRIPPREDRNESPLSFFFSLFFLGAGGGGVFFMVIFFFSLSSFFQLVYGVTGGTPDNRRMGCEFALLLLFFLYIQNDNMYIC